MARICGVISIATVLWLMPFSVLAVETPALMLATRWEAGDDPAGWWMSEKYDGVRGFWDGSHMVTRQGQPITIPDTLRAALPDFSLDGELWAGYGRFEVASATVRDRAPGQAWSAMRYLVFDAPGHTGPFEARIAALKAWLHEHPSLLVHAVEQVRCNDALQLGEFLRAVEARGGEGVMLRAPASPYVAGRSGLLRKYKSFEDGEATVLGYNAGRGKYAGVVGSLQVVLPNGTRFAVGSGLDEQERREPPPIGSVITFRHQGWTAHGRPRFPVFWRVRELPESVAAQ